MNADVLLLATAGIVAILSGAITVLLATGGARTLLAAAGLVLVGLLQVGFARVAIDAPWGGGAFWFHTTLALAVPTTALWALLSAVLGRRTSEPLSRSWRIYLTAQAVVSLAALAQAALAPDADGPLRGALHLDAPQRAVLAAILINVLLFTVRFESAYFSFSRRDRRAFRPALAGIVIAAVYFASLAASGIVAGRAGIGDLAVGAVPVTLLALLVPVSFVRGRLGAARFAPSRHPATATTSYILAGVFLAATATTVWLTHAAGTGTIRGLWALVTVGVIVAFATIVLSHRARRQAERLFAPVWTDWRGPHRAAVARAVAPLDRVATLEALCRAIPENAKAVARVDPVTLLLPHRPSASFRAVATTLESLPDATIGDRDPLAAELRRARRPIRLQGRPDDLDFVSIYVENGSAIEACRARIAAPLWGEAEMIGVLLCGKAPALAGSAKKTPTLAALHLATKHYAALIERLAGLEGEGVQITTR